MSCFHILSGSIIHLLHNSISLYVLCIFLIMSSKQLQSVAWLCPVLYNPIIIRGYETADNWLNLDCNQCITIIISLCYKAKIHRGVSIYLRHRPYIAVERDRPHQIGPNIDCKGGNRIVTNELWAWRGDRVCVWTAVYIDLNSMPHKLFWRGAACCSACVKTSY